MSDDHVVKVIAIMWIAAAVMCLGDAAVKIFAPKCQCASHAEKAKESGHDR